MMKYHSNALIWLMKYFKYKYAEKNDVAETV